MAKMTTAQRNEFIDQVLDYAQAYYVAHTHLLNGNKEKYLEGVVKEGVIGRKLIEFVESL